MSEKPQQNLGRYITVYRRRPISWSKFLSLSLIGMVSVFVPLFYGFYQFHYAYTKHGKIAASNWSRPWYLLAILNLLIYCILIIVHRKYNHRRIILYAWGLLINSKKKIFWDHIFGVAYGIVQTTLFSCRLAEHYIATIHLFDRTRINLDPHLIGLPDLVSRIQSKVLPNIIPLTENEFVEGNWLDFGVIRINKRFMRILGKDIPWFAIRGMSVHEGNLVVELADEPDIHLEVNKIPNLELVLRIVNAGIRM